MKRVSYECETKDTSQATTKVATTHRSLPICLTDFEELALSWKAYADGQGKLRHEKQFLIESLGH